jgi:uncharacterized protein
MSLRAHGKLLAATIVAIAGYISAPVPVEAQSFNCSKAGTDVEHAICDTSFLGDLDLEMSNLYYGLRARLSQPGRNALRRDQKRWLGYRDSCGYAIRCIEQSYLDRISELNEWHRNVSN